MSDQKKELDGKNNLEKIAVEFGIKLSDLQATRKVFREVLSGRN